MLELVREQTRVLSIASKIHSEVEGKLNSRHREYYLRQQLKAIRSELGEEVTVTRRTLTLSNHTYGKRKRSYAFLLMLVLYIFASC